MTCKPGATFVSALCFVSASEPESQTTGQNPAITLQRQTRASLCPKRAYDKGAYNKRFPTEECMTAAIYAPQRGRACYLCTPWCHSHRQLQCLGHSHVCLQLPTQGIQAGWVPFCATGGTDTWYFYCIPGSLL